MPSEISPNLKTFAALTLALLSSCIEPGLDWQRPEYGEPERPEYLQDYIDAHYQDLGEQFIARLSMERFLDRLRRSRVLFLGDHHRDPELHERMLSVLTSCTERGHRPAIGLEAIGLEDMPNVNEYLTGRIDMRELRRRVRRRNPETWLDAQNEVDASFFRALLTFAREQRLPVFALEPTPRLPLHQRDAVIARSIRAAAQEWPDKLLVVVVGHAHLLGKGRLRARVALPSTAIGARMSPKLSKAYVSYRRPETPCLLETTASILFFHPMTRMGLMLPKDEK